MLYKVVGSICKAGIYKKKKKKRKNVKTQLGVCFGGVSLKHDES